MTVLLFIFLPTTSMQTSQSPFLGQEQNVKVDITRLRDDGAIIDEQTIILWITNWHMRDLIKLYGDIKNGHNQNYWIVNANITSSRRFDIEKITQQIKDFLYEEIEPMLGDKSSYEIKDIYLG